MALIPNIIQEYELLNQLRNTSSYAPELWDINHCKIKLSKKFTRSEKLRRIILN